ncbi:hypothetical protein ACFSBZ_14120 [Amnibacterium flavum]|uniref:Uncharacterized protein n=1 Tax=Amnibacterium flavum TaxID=2173173 RepID=A0A2V1HYK1_9MICO|nr:hypothetical protein [Amnibacterium flavum]PVZ95887.1 hypothetical protein DDQ50_05325 [Amnibacterium flavum]
MSLKALPIYALLLVALIGVPAIAAFAVSFGTSASAGADVVSVIPAIAVWAVVGIGALVTGTVLATSSRRRPVLSPISTPVAAPVTVVETAPAEAGVVTYA